MKTHIRVNVGSCLVHTAVSTPAKVHDVTQAMRYCTSTRPPRMTMPGTGRMHKREEA